MDTVYRTDLLPVPPVAGLPREAASDYAAFTERLGLVETHTREGVRWTPADEQTWTLSPEKAAEAVKDLPTHTGETFTCIAAMLSDALNRMEAPSRRIPPHVISYQCRDVATRAILQRFNETTGYACSNLTELSYIISDQISDANALFNSLRFCDPAAGTGVFLSALSNELIAVKSQLGILADADGHPLFQYRVTTEGGEPVVMDRRRVERCTLTASDPESERIRSTLLREKRTLITHCLFGVEADARAVDACRLRLWLEILKHAAGDVDAPNAWETAYAVRCGDALVSRFSMQEDLRHVFKRAGFSVEEYKRAAGDCRQARTKDEKQAAAQRTDLFRMKIQRELVRDDRNHEDLLKWQRELEALKAPALFAPDETEATTVKNRIVELQASIDRCRQKIEHYSHNLAFAHAVEWRYEFPEVWNETGDCTGFDAVIGYPPDARPASESHAPNRRSAHAAHKQTDETFSLYCELGNRLLRKDGVLSYITSAGWTKAGAGERMRRYLTEDTNPLLMIEFDGRKETVPVNRYLLVLQKAHNSRRTKSCRVNADFDPERITLEDYIAQHAALSAPDARNASPTVASLFAVHSDTEKSIQTKIEQAGAPLETWDIRTCASILTGCDKAFIVNTKTRDEFILADYKNTDILKPLLSGNNVRRYVPEKAENWLICIPWHFPLLYDTTIKTASDRAEQRFRQQYPIICEHLEQYRDALFNRDTKEVGVTFEWYALQRYCNTENEWGDFLTQKIVWKREAQAAEFCIDYHGCAILEPACFLVGQRLKFLLAVLNSKMGRYLLRDLPQLPDGRVQIHFPALTALKVPVPNIRTESELISWVNRRTSDAHPEEHKTVERKINEYIYEMYCLNQKERDFIESTISIN
ncbi:MAG: hypothetical protein LBD27_05560 [Tannerella sp.]|nr:hypothetical protein [Tannerella sp.]